MPALSGADLTLLRTTRHATLLSLAVYQPATIWTAQVNGAQTAGATSIVVDNVVQLRAPVRHYQVWFGSTLGARDLGETRWKSYAAPNLVVAPHNSPLANDTYITVKEFIPPAGIPCTISDTDVVSEDGDLAYTNQNVQYSPLARIGPPACAFIDPGTGLATVKFWSSSAAIATGATLSSHAWTFPSGTPNSSAIAGTAGAPITVTWNAVGQYWVAYTVTDSNGKTHTRYNPVFIYDRLTGQTPYRRIAIESLRGERSSSGSMRITVYTSAAPLQYPEGAQVVLFAEDWFGDTKVSIGGQWTWRENILFTGYIRGGTVKKDWLQSSVSFEVQGIGALGETINALGFSLETNATPTDWHQLSGLTYNRAAHHILTQHSTFSQIADVNLNLPTYTKEYVDCMDGNLKDQLAQQVAAPDRGVFGSSMQGMIYLCQNPQFMPSASRTEPVVLSSTLADFRDELDMGIEESTKQVTQVDFCGEDAAGDPFFSLAPPNPWPTGHQGVEQVDGIRVTDQAESNIVAGLVEGERNNSYKEVIFPWRGNYRVSDIFPIEKFQINLTSLQNARGIIWTNQVFYPVSVSYEYKPGILLATTVMEKDTVGAAGITGDTPTDEPTIPTPTTIPSQPVIVPPTNPPATGTGTRTYIATDKGVYYTENFLDSPPTWVAANAGLSGAALDVIRLFFDPWSGTSQDHLTTAYILTWDGVYKNTSLPTGTWSQVLSAAQVNALIGAGTVNWNRVGTCSINTQNFIGLWLSVGGAAGAWGTSNGYYIYSLDGGATWSKNATAWLMMRVCNPNGSGRGIAIGWHMVASHKTAGVVWLFADTENFWSKADAFSETIRVFKATGNSTWVLQGAGNWASPKPKFIMPYADGSGTPYANDSRVYDIEGSTLYRTTTFPAATPLDPANWTGIYAAPATLVDFDLCTWDEDFQYLITSTRAIGTKNDWGTQTVTTFASHDLFAISCLPANASFCAIAGRQDIGLGVYNAVVKRTLDGADNWTDVTGNLIAVSGTAADVRSIAPDWVKT